MILLINFCFGMTMILKSLMHESLTLTILNTVRHSEDENIPLLGTSLPSFEITGKFYQILNR